ncbi:MAG: serine/threonine-protein kinase, partial [Candidatus Methylacidiphilales bacterium]
MTSATSNSDDNTRPEEPAAASQPPFADEEEDQPRNSAAVHHSSPPRPPNALHSPFVTRGNGGLASDDATILEGPAATILDDGDFSGNPGEANLPQQPEPTLPSPGTATMVGEEIGGHVLKEPIRVLSAEADLWKVLHEPTGETRVLKHFRWGVTPKDDVSEALAKNALRHVIHVFNRGIHEGRHYEVQEYIREGSLSDVLRRKTLPQDSAPLIIQQLAEGIRELHQIGVLHRDVKPSNILVRSLDPVELVLTDFGISSLADVSLHLTSASRTAAYSAPEALTGVVTRGSDWWSAGVVILEVLSGRHPFDGLSEQAVNFQLVTQGIPVPESLHEDYRLLLRGLLARDYRHRWAYDEVSAWCQGRRDMPVPVEQHQESPAAATKVPGRQHSHRSYKFHGAEYATPEDLSMALAANWTEGVKHFGRGFITDWVKMQIFDQTLASLLVDVSLDKDLTADEKLSVALLLLNPDLPLIYKGEWIVPGWMPGHAEQAAALLRGSLGAWLSDLRNDRWLIDMQHQRRRLRGELKEMGLQLDDSLVKVLMISDLQSVVETALEHRKKFASAKDPKLRDLLAKPELRPCEAIALLAVDHGSYLSLAEMQEAERRQHTEEIASRFQQRKISFSRTAIGNALAMAPEEAIRLAKERMDKYQKASHPALQRLFDKRSTLTHREAAAFLAADTSQFLTAEDLAREFAEREREGIIARLKHEEVMLDWATVDRILDDRTILAEELRKKHEKFAKVKRDYPRLHQIFIAKDPEFEEGLLL